MRVAQLSTTYKIDPPRRPRPRWPRAYAAVLDDRLVRIAHMGTALAASNVARGGIQFVTSLVVARGLGRDGFGVWTLAAAAASALTAAFDLGFGVLLTREAARSDGRIGRLLVDAFAARFTLFLPVALFAYSGLLTSWTGAIQADTLHAAVVLAAVGLAYGTIASACRAAPRPLVSIVSIETVGALLQCAGVTILLLRGAGIAALLYLATAMLAAQSAAALVVWRRIAPLDRLTWSSAQSTWSALRRAVPFALTGLIANAQARLGPLLLAGLASTGDVALFGVATRLAGVARRLPSSAFGAALPVFSQEASSGPATSVRTQFARSVRWFAVAAAVVLVVGASSIVRLTYGAPFAAATTPLLIAGLGLVPTLVNSSRKVYLFASGRERVVLRWSAATLAVQVAACLLLIPRFGAAGAMAGLAIGEAAIWLPLRRADGASWQAPRP